MTSTVARHSDSVLLGSEQLFAIPVKLSNCAVLGARSLSIELMLLALVNAVIPELRTEPRFAACASSSAAVTVKSFTMFVVSKVAIVASVTLIASPPATSTVAAAFNSAAVAVVLIAFSCAALDAVLNLLSSAAVLVTSFSLFKSKAATTAPSNRFSSAIVLVVAANVFKMSVLGAELSLLSSGIKSLGMLDAMFSSDAVLVTVAPDNWSVAASISVDAKSANTILEP